MAEQKPNQLKRWWGHLKHWVHHHKKAAIVGVIALICLIVAASMIVLALFYQEPVKETTPPKPKPVAKPVPSITYYSPLTGEKVATEAETKKPVTAIIIENSPEARPQSGLAEAEVVYEAIAEGGITRFLTLYQNSKPQLIGPVRSLRPYYVDWLTPYQPSVGHVGGRKRSLDTIRNGSYRDIDQFFNPGTYWRTRDRRMPHNVYTNFEKIDALNASKNYTVSDAKPLVHGDTKPNPTPAPTTINVAMSSPWYNSTWQYDQASNSYLRSQNGAPHMDREKGHISTKVVVVLKMTMDTIWEDGPRENYHVTGSGEAVVFQDGTATDVNWHKADINSQISFTNKDGSPFALARGKVWFTAIPINERGSVSWQ